MKKFLFSAAVAVATLVGVAAPSFAATLTSVSTGAGANGTNNLGTFSGPGGATFDVAGIASGSGNFTETFQFTLTADSNVTITQGTLTPAASFDIDITTGGAGSITPLPGGTSVPGFALRLFDIATSAAGTVFNLVLTGQRPSSGSASVDGSIAFTAFSAPSASPVPIPGALLLMGSVLMGGAGLAKWRKGGSRLAALAA
jgi:hypothetical protein